MVPATAAVAQTTTAAPPPSETPATDAVGPRELQNFSLPGTRTRPADPAPAAPVLNPPPPRADDTPAQARTATAAPRPAPTRETTQQAAPVRTAPMAIATPSTSPDVAPTNAEPAPATYGPPQLPTTSAPPPNAPATATPSSFSLWPWIAAAIALAVGGLFLFWRRHHNREEFAGGPQFDMFVAPEPAPPVREPQLPPIPRAPPPPVAAPQPQPQPAPKPAAPAGIVSSRLRPSIEIAIQPLRCLVEENQVTIEFELELFNSGSAPARAVLAEASMFNAGVTQDEQLARFFANPVGAGSGIDAIPPLNRINLVSKVVAPRDAIQEYELGGRRAFVPVIAFNALYDWSGGKAQTSSAYLVGRETRGDKLGPLHLDSDAKREVRALAARELPSQLRT
jgi:hypothetical protein